MPTTVAPAQACNGEGLSAMVWVRRHPIPRAGAVSLRSGDVTAAPDWLKSDDGVIAPLPTVLELQRLHEPGAPPTSRDEPRSAPASPALLPRPTA